MKDRRTILAGALGVFRGTLFGQKNSPGVATGPAPFGYKMAWMAVKCGKLDDLVSFLELKDRRPVSWKDGIDLAYDENAKLVFLTPPIQGWIFVVGWGAAAIADAEPVKSFYNTLDLLSDRFGDAQAFATHRVIEYHLWMQAQSGHVVRSFAYAGETGKLLDNMGPLTEAEHALTFFNRPQDQWSPGEEDVMTVAGRWSLDPTKLTNESGPEELGIVARVGLKI